MVNAFKQKAWFKLCFCNAISATKAIEILQKALKDDFISQKMNFIGTKSLRMVENSL